MAAFEPVRLALIGAGIFARDAHLPAIQALGDAFDVVAIYSRTHASADALAGRLAKPVNIYTDLSALLARDDIEAVDIVLPIDVMPPVVAQALESGKHVVSEKPIAPDVATGRQLLAKRSSQVWMIAENYRYDEAFIEAEQVLKSGEIGNPLLCNWAIHVGMVPGNKYYQTEWRRSGGFPGGFLLDGGVHYMSVLRMLLGEIASVNAVVRQVRPDLSPADTLGATLCFDSGLIGTLAVTYAAPAPWTNTLHIAGEHGALSVHNQGLEVTSHGATRSNVIARTGVEGELAAFASAIHEGKPHRNTPEQALQDLAVVEAMLRAAQMECSTAPERVIG